LNLNLTEIQRYIDKCRELSQDGEYSWWLRLAEILTELSRKNKNLLELATEYRVSSNAEKDDNEVLVSRINDLERELKRYKFNYEELKKSYDRQTQRYQRIMTEK
jgi:hypothetical protein